ncbi:MAG: hypothetical protein U0521_06705 [Anaerolineae bacterium]
MAAQVVDQYGIASFKSFVSYDPAPDWAQTIKMVLGLFGGKDACVDAEQNVRPRWKPR